MVKSKHKQRERVLCIFIDLLRAEQRADFTYSTSGPKYQLYKWSDEYKGHVQVFDKYVPFEEAMRELTMLY